MTAAASPIVQQPGLLDEVRSKFAHVDSCPFQGARIFFENAGGALTLNAVVETSAKFAAIPDNPGRANPAGQALTDLIKKAKADLRVFCNAPEDGVGGRFIVGESGTELIFRLVRTAVVASADGGTVLSSTLEHPATRSAAAHWADVTGRSHVLVAHDDVTGTVDAAAYRAALTPDVRVATILHTSPVTGMAVDIAAIAGEIRAVAPDAYIIVDGIQHACHGMIDLAAYGVDAYAMSAYKVFARHGYGLAWISERLTHAPHEMLIDAPAGSWELGTRDAGAYATFSDVIDYFEWLGSKFTDSIDRRSRIIAAGQAIHAHEHSLTDAMISGVGNLKGLAELPGVTILGGADNPAREGLVSITVAGLDAEDVVARLNEQGIRTHTRKADHYSGNILTPLGLDSCVRVSLCHYNSEAEVAQFLGAIAEIAG